jgi:single-strand DNA-binding protein
VAGSFNKIILVGNLTRDPEIRYVGSGAAVTKFTLAVNRRSKQQEETDYIDIVAWDKLAETCNTYLKKGMSCLVEGRLSIRSYESKEGEKRKATEVVCNSMQMLDRAGAGGGGGRNYENGDGGGSSYERPAAPARPAASSSAGFEEDAALEDEIPF